MSCYQLISRYVEQRRTPGKLRKVQNQHEKSPGFRTLYFWPRDHQFQKGEIDLLLIVKYVNVVQWLVEVILNYVPCILTWSSFSTKMVNLTCVCFPCVCKCVFTFEYILYIYANVNRNVVSIRLWHFGHCLHRKLASFSCLLGDFLVRYIAFLSFTTIILWIFKILRRFQRLHFGADLRAGKSINVFNHKRIKKEKHDSKVSSLQMLYLLLLSQLWWAIMEEERKSHLNNSLNRVVR